MTVKPDPWWLAWVLRPIVEILITFALVAGSLPIWLLGIWSYKDREIQSTQQMVYLAASITVWTTILIGLLKKLLSG